MRLVPTPEKISAELEPQNLDRFMDDTWRSIKESTGRDPIKSNGRHGKTVKTMKSPGPRGFGFREPALTETTDSYGRRSVVAVVSEQNSNGGFTSFYTRVQGKYYGRLEVCTVITQNNGESDTRSYPESFNDLHDRELAMGIIRKTAEAQARIPVPVVASTQHLGAISLRSVPA